MAHTVSMEDMRKALTNGSGTNKLRLTIILEGSEATLVRQALAEFGVEKGGYRAFVRRAIIAEMEKLYDERDAKAAVAEAEKATQAPAVAVKPKQPVTVSK